MSIKSYLLENKILMVNVPIGRKKFFIGILIVAIITVILQKILSIFLGYYGNIVLNFLIVVIFSTYAFSVLWTKRYLDIKPSINVKKVQVILIAWLFVFNVSRFFWGIALSKTMVELNATGSMADNTSPISRIFSIVFLVLLIPQIIIALTLLFKKGNKIENHSRI